ncbi:hypothetical protein BJ085DRAFT_40965 [Dimargaris cristalligena]|uniref:Uncharacterized protein n=1 Tax=Dimargaris cristalligena TaxID=215637 RepID=A0A4P9ZW59_9FUNG|nr:hypothetical protein BJ085DRAFT_40965 [Dimargaris cristalligena]|eukprot:RKP37092.1 hypothetical protein BJ085DRAFT_40965 [Dimargaris cristalligena]
MCSPIYSQYDCGCGFYQGDYQFCSTAEQAGGRQPCHYLTDATTRYKSLMCNTYDCEDLRAEY